VWFPHWLFWVPFHSCYSLAAAAQFITPIYMIQSVVQLVVFCTCSFRKLCIRGSQPFLPMHLFSSCHNVVPHLQDYLTQQVHSEYSEKYYLLFNCALYIVSLMHFAGLPSLHVLLMSTVWPIKIIGITSVIFAKGQYSSRLSMPVCGCSETLKFSPWGNSGWELLHCVLFHASCVTKVLLCILVFVTTCIYKCRLQLGWQW